MKERKVLILNLPYLRPIIRKYSCSYFANGFLYPPVELLRVFEIIKIYGEGKFELSFKDSVADKLNEQSCIDFVKKTEPELIICMASVDFFSHENNFVGSLKKQYPVPVVVIGYIPSLNPECFATADVILGNGFEGIVSTASKLCNGDDLVSSFIQNLSTSNSGDLLFDADIIPRYDFSQVQHSSYQELFARGKTAFTYFSFGCPFKCSFCVRTYNLKNVYYRSSENILDELRELNRLGYKNVRILDDNCTLNRQLLEDIKLWQDKNGIKFNYYGLTRLDLLDEKMIILLNEIGFKTLYIGIETIKTETQLEYGKKLDLSFHTLKNLLELIRKAGITVNVFLMFDMFTETRSDIFKTLKFLRRLPIRFASLNYVIPYPGTEYYNKHSGKFCFSSEAGLIWNKSSRFDKNLKWHEFIFFFSFYCLNPMNFISLLKRTITYPKQTIQMGLQFFKFIFGSKSSRKDYF